MYRSVILSIFFLQIVSAASLGPIIYEQDDFGDPLLEEFTYSLSVDCEGGVVKAIVMNESLQREADAQTFLKYVDFASPLISSETTDSMGVVEHALPGNVSLMTGLFILVIEKEGFRAKEVHFDITVCLTGKSYVPPPPEPEPLPPPPQGNYSPPIPEDPEEEVPGENISEDETNVTAVNGDEEQYADPCAPAFLIPLLMLFKRRQMK